MGNNSANNKTTSPPTEVNAADWPSIEAADVPPSETSSADWSSVEPPEVPPPEVVDDSPSPSKMALEEAEKQPNERKDNCVVREKCCPNCKGDLELKAIDTLLPSTTPHMTKYTKADFIVALNRMFKKYAIDSCIKRIHFLAQVFHESGSKLDTEENGGPDDFARYEGGHFYHGRGLLQLTHRSAYKSYLNSKGLAFNQENCRLIQTDMALATDSAGWIWIKPPSGWGNCNHKAAENDFIAITVAINGGFNGILDRKKWLKKFYDAFIKNKSSCNLKKISVTSYKVSKSRIRHSNFWKTGNGKKFWKNTLGNSKYEI